MSSIRQNAPSDYIALVSSLGKQAYSNILKILPPKTEKFQIKILVFFHISAENMDCGYSLEPPRRGGSNEYHNLCFRDSSNEYPQSMFSAEI